MPNNLYISGVKSRDKITIHKAVMDNEMTMSAYLRPLVERIANFEREHGSLPNTITLSFGNETDEIKYNLKPHY